MFQLCLKSFVVIALTSVAVVQAHALSLDWSGVYRFEYFGLGDPQLDKGPGKSYFLNHLALQPTIIATDDLKISAEFQVLPNTDHPYSRLGQAMGIGGGQSGSTLGDSQGATSLVTTKLYMTWEQEFGALLVGRTPIEFGLGMTHNSGLNPFDHWQDIHDLIGYKVSFGNFFIMPMIGEVFQDGIGEGAGITDQMIHVQYENEEAGSLFGIFYQSRDSDRASNDSGGRFPDAQDEASEGFESSRVNIAVGRTFETLAITVEGGFLTGDTGVENADGDAIELDGFGIASEIEYRPAGSKFTGGLHLGYASGDDPTTSAYEGYVFDRNYNVAMLLMNHPLGAPGQDFLGTSPYRNTGADPSEAFDVESIANVIYLSPYINWSWSETIGIGNRFTYATLVEEPFEGADLSLGFEWDISVIYKPHERVQWITEVGLLLPGDAFAGGDNGFDTEFTYGIGTKAAISF